LAVLVPWIVLYEITAHLHLAGRTFQFDFEDRLPIYSWTAAIYQSIYLVAAAAPWLARTRSDLRRLTVSAWISMAVVFPFYWLVPSTAPRRHLAVTSWIARVLEWERDTYPPTAAFPSFHVLWVIFLARLIRPEWLGIAYAAAVTVSCISTGMQRVEFGSARDVAVVGHSGPTRKRQLPLGRAEHLDPVDTVELGNFVGQSHFLQVAHRPGGQAVAARLVAGEFGLVQHDHFGAGLGGLPRSGGTRWSTAGDCHVVALRHRSRLVLRESEGGGRTE
jgi:hypothetical protein